MIHVDQKISLGKLYYRAQLTKYTTERTRQHPIKIKELVRLAASLADNEGMKEI